MRLPSLILLLLTAACTEAPAPAPIDPPEPPPAAHAEPIGPQPATVHSYHIAEVRPGQAMSTTLQKIGVTAREVDTLVRAMKELVDFRTVRPGQTFEIKRDEQGRLRWLRYIASRTNVFGAWRGSDDVWFARRIPVFVKTSTVMVSGTVEYSLAQAVSDAGEGAAVTAELVGAFAWDVDFFTETQPGDSFSVVLEKRYVESDFVGYGRLLGAEYQLASGRSHRALRYEFSDGKVGYYREDGTAVERAFLKSPIQFASITSRYGMRRHPVLKYARKHKGVDYGAPRGTSIWAVGDGVVTFVGRKGGYGNVVFIRHANGLQTRYAHLSRFGKGLRRGQRVAQKKVIGYVGSTGLATGPHLHFEVLQQGRHTNPLSVAAPPAPPIPDEELERFKTHVAPVATKLQKLKLTASDAPGP